VKVAQHQALLIVGNPRFAQSLVVGRALQQWTCNLGATWSSEALCPCKNDSLVNQVPGVQGMVILRRDRTAMQLERNGFMPVSVRTWGCCRLALVTVAFAYYTVWIFATVRR